MYRKNVELKKVNSKHILKSTLTPQMQRKSTSTDSTINKSPVVSTITSGKLNRRENVSILMSSWIHAYCFSPCFMLPPTYALKWYEYIRFSSKTPRKSFAATLNTIFQLWFWKQNSPINCIQWKMFNFNYKPTTKILKINY